MDPPVAAIDTKNIVHVIWSEQRGNGDERVYIQYRCFDGSEWSAAQTIVSPLPDQHDPQDYAIATDADNNVHVVWSEWYQRGGHYLWFNGTKWSASQTISPVFMGKVALTKNNDGRLFMTFVGAVEGKLTWRGVISPHEPARERLEVLHYGALRGGRWIVLGRLGGADGPEGAASAIAVTHNETVHILYESSVTHDRTDIRYAVVSSGKSTELNVSRGQDFCPTIALDGSGVAHCAWGDVGVSYCQIENERVRNRFDNLVPDGRDPVLAIDSSQNVHLVCLLISEDRIAYMMQKNGRWGPIVRIGDGTFRTPALAVDQRGNRYLFWMGGSKLYGCLIKAGDN